MCKNDLHLLEIKDPNDALTNEHFMLLPSTVRAFVLREKRFMNLSVNLIEDFDGEMETDLNVLKRKSGLHYLVLLDGVVDILESLIVAQPATELPIGIGNPVERRSLSPSSREGQDMTVQDSLAKRAVLIKI